MLYLLYCTGVKSLSRLTSVPFLTNVGAVVEYRQKKLQTYLQVSFDFSQILVFVFVRLTCRYFSWLIASVD